jgi:hypothetical protein
MYDPALGRGMQPNTVVPVGVQGVQAWTGMRMLITIQRGSMIHREIALILIIAHGERIAGTKCE